MVDDDEDKVTRVTRVVETTMIPPVNENPNELL